MNALPSELRHALRKLARTPLFTTIAVLTLALGIGANSAVFSVLHGVLLKPLPYAEPERLVGLWHEAPGAGFDLVNQAPATYFTYREDAQSFTDVGMWDNAQVAVTGLEEPEQVVAMQVTDGTLPILGIRPALGRLFSREDDTPGTPETVILSHGYWQSHFAADPAAIGRTLVVDGTARQIIGVLPRDLRFLDHDPALYLPFRFDRAAARMDNFSFQGVARLQPGATLEQANAEVARLIPVATERFPGGLSLSMMQEIRFGPKVRPLKMDAVGDVGAALWVLFGTVGMVLLIAGANVANLFLVRAESRQLEVAVRTALGASRAAVMRTFLSESVLLGLLGGLAGLGLAWAGLQLLLAIGPESLPRLHEISLDGPVLGFTAAISLLAGLLFGLVPGLRRSGPNLAVTLKEGGRGGSEGRQRQRARHLLVVTQIALALVLMVGSGLMMRSFEALRHVDPGFVRPAEVLTVRVTIPEAEIAGEDQVALAYEQIFQRIAEIPGVTSVGMSSSITMDGFDNNNALQVEDFPTPEGQLPPIRRFKEVSPGYFETMGNALLAGRPIEWDDLHQQKPVVVITEDLARTYWPSPQAALGRRVRAGSDGRWAEIVGVAGNIHDNGVDQPAVPTTYWPMVQRDAETGEVESARWMAYAIRTARPDALSLRQEVQRAVGAVNPNLPLASVRTLDEILQGSMARTSFTLVMLAIAAGVALLLGAVGIYGVTSYSVAQRTREIGVRLALGAAQRDVRRLVLHQALLLASIGVAVGLAAAFGLTRLMTTLLFGVQAIDPLTYGTVAAALVAVALAASYLPARRAARTDPIIALRWE